MMSQASSVNGLELLVNPVGGSTATNAARTTKSRSAGARGTRKSVVRRAVIDGHYMSRIRRPRRAHDDDRGRGKQRVSGRQLAPPSGSATLPHCERCGNLIGPAATLMRIGLRICPSCGVFACDRCWGKAGGACPGCGASTASGSEGPVAAEAAALREGDLARDRRGGDLRSPIAVAALVVVSVMVSVIALNVRSPFRPAGDVAGATGAPAAAAG